VRLGQLFGAFAKDSRGNVAIIVAFVFVPLTVLAGGATDVARFESYRVQLQDGVDRGVLAATSLMQTKTVQDTVVNYLKSVAFTDDVVVTVLQDAETTSVKTVTVRASYTMPTAFLPLIGIQSMEVVAQASAEERRQNVEISLMLDFSGSMDGSKFTSLKAAAKDFVGTMLTAETKPYTTLSIVPYAGQVNVGAAVFDGLGGVRSHAFSSCLQMNNADYAKGMVNFSGRAQVPNFTRWNGTDARPTLPVNMNAAWCPGDNDAMTVLSNDAVYLKSRIDGYQMYDGTGSGIAMNWGLMLLDPSAQPLVAQAAAAGMVQPAFANRPAAYSNTDTVKVLVLMTDGAITEQYTAKDPSLPARAPNNYKDLLDPVGNVKQTSSVTAGQLSKVCTVAKANRVIVFTIGFQTDSTAQTQMRNCASSPSNFYDVQSLDIASAFRSVATAIQKIKLTQ
jgi:Flp pilus assembly protein TadG